jgi:hypothetical protein
MAGKEIDETVQQDVSGYTRRLGVYGTGIEARMMLFGNKIR